MDHLTAYQKVWNADLLHSAVNSALIASGTTLLTLGLAVPAAYALARLRGMVVRPAGVQISDG